MIIRARSSNSNYQRLKEAKKLQKAQEKKEKGALKGLAQVTRELRKSNRKQTPSPLVSTIENLGKTVIGVGAVLAVSSVVKPNLVDLCKMIPVNNNPELPKTCKKITTQASELFAKGSSTLQDLVLAQFGLGSQGSLKFNPTKIEDFVPKVSFDLDKITKRNLEITQQAFKASNNFQDLPLNEDYYQRFKKQEKTLNTISDRLWKEHQIYLPSWVLGAIGEREFSLKDINTYYFHNGQELGKKTTIVPEGKFFKKGDGVNAAIDAILGEIDKYPALKGKNAQEIKNLPLEKQLVFFLAFTEYYNGLGYTNNGVPSAYNWGLVQSTLGKSGFYEKDGKFNRNKSDTRHGTFLNILTVFKKYDGKNNIVPKPSSPKTPNQTTKKTANPKK